MNNASRFDSYKEAYETWVRLSFVSDFNTWLFELLIQGTEDNPSAEPSETWATEDPNT